MVMHAIAMLRGIKVDQNLVNFFYWAAHSGRSTKQLHRVFEVYNTIQRDVSMQAEQEVLRMLLRKEEPNAEKATDT